MASWRQIVAISDLVLSHHPTVMMMVYSQVLPATCMPDCLTGKLSWQLLMPSCNQPSCQQPFFLTLRAGAGLQGQGPAPWPHCLLVVAFGGHLFISVDLDVAEVDRG